MRKITPINGHVLLKQVDESEQMAGSIYLPDLGKEKPLICEAVAISPTYNWHIGMVTSSDVEVGDLVIIPRMGSQTISVDNEDYIICKETDIIGIVK
jgi:chaperonin GroES